MSDSFLLEDEMMMLIPQILETLDNLNELFGTCETQSVEVAGIVMRDTFSDEFKYLPIHDHEDSDDDVVRSLCKTSEAVRDLYTGYLKNTNNGEAQ